MKTILIVIFCLISLLSFSQYKQDDSDADHLAKGYVQFGGDRYSPEIDALTNSIIDSDCVKTTTNRDTITHTFSVKLTVPEYQVTVILHEYVPYEQYQYISYDLTKKDGHGFNMHYFSESSLKDITVARLDDILMSKYYALKNNCGND